MDSDTPIMSADEFNEFIRQTRQSKYGNQKVRIDGIEFASLKESRRYQDLKIMEKGGLIRDVHVHPAFEMVVNNVRIGRYTADFAYTDNRDDAYVVEDVKSRATKTEAYGLRKKLIKALFGYDIQEV